VVKVAVVVAFVSPIKGSAMLDVAEKRGQSPLWDPDPNAAFRGISYSPRRARFNATCLLDA
jgi:hypothetical protein